MKKNNILSFALIALLFVGLTWFANYQSREYNQKVQAYNDSVNAANPQPIVEEVEPITENGDSTAMSSEPQQTAAQQADSVKRSNLEIQLGESLYAAKFAEAETFTVETPLLKIDFSTRGAMITDVELKEFGKYAPKGEERQRVKMFDPESAVFNFDFAINNGAMPIAINTMDYTFAPLGIDEMNDGSQVVKMRLDIAQGGYLQYNYTIHNSENQSRDYLIDLSVEMKGLESYMAGQKTMGVKWGNRSYQNEKGFDNENNNTLLCYYEVGENDIDDIGMSRESKHENLDETISWIAFKQQFFSSIFFAKNNFNNSEVGFNTAKPGSGYIKDFTSKMNVNLAAEGETLDFGLYYGPNKYAILKNVELTVGEDDYVERLIPLGWGIFGWINRFVVIPVFDFLRTFIGSFGIIILILAVLVKVVVFPMTYSSYVSMAKMRLLKPEIDQLNAKYPKQEDAMKKQQATMDLYKKTGVNPMGGCLPMLIQMPIIFAMFRFFPASIELRDQPFLWADDLSSFDSICNLPVSLPFYGDHVSLFALLMAVSMFGFSYMNYQQSASSQPQMAGMKFMMVYMMPAMMIFFFNGYSSGLCYYYLLANILTIGQTMIVRKLVDDTKIRNIMASNAAKKKNNTGKKSKFQLRYEEMMRQAQEQQQQKK